MKHKKLALVIILAGFLAVGWVFSLRSATGLESREKQQALIGEADVYFQKELWVRAIPLYEEALQYKTEDNPAIESSLLKAYMSYGDMAAYQKLVEKRASGNRASEEEYINAAEAYLAISRLQKGMELVKQGIDQGGSQKLIDYYEENRYAYSINVTKYDDIKPTKDNALMPAYGENGWCYVDKNAREQLKGPYEEAFRFNAKGYAVVKQNGKYDTILKNGDRYGTDGTGITAVYDMSGERILAKREEKYSYYSYDFTCVAEVHQYEAITANACGVAAVKKGDKWGIITDGGKTVVDFMLQDVAVNSLGAVFANDKAMVKMEGSWYLVDTRGEKICETGFAEAKAPESAGYIAVGNGEKWGFINDAGELVIDCQYEDALSFSDGLAPVKIVNTWNYISTKNKRVIEQEFTDAQPFHNKVAQAQVVGKEALIELEYTEE